MLKVVEYGLILKAIIYTNTFMKHLPCARDCARYRVCNGKEHWYEQEFKLQHRNLQKKRTKQNIYYMITMLVKKILIGCYWRTYFRLSR